MSKLSFILGVALLIVAATLAITITIGPRASTSVSEAPDSTVSSKRPEARTSRSYVSPKGPRTFEETEEGRSEHFRVEAPPNHPNHAQLAQTANTVEQEARFQLGRLTKQLDLTGHQRKQLFPLLVQGTSRYTPELIISGEFQDAPKMAGRARDEEIAKVLDEEQQEQQIDNALDDLLLWQEIIGNLQDRLEAETPHLNEQGSPDVPNEATPGRRGNLGELLEK